VVLPSLAGGAEAAAAATLAAMAEEKCTLMLADSHTLKAGALYRQLRCIPSTLIA
jgi:hypothetical protein